MELIMEKYLCCVSAAMATNLIVFIVYKDKIRVAVSTGNLIQIDYERKTQVLFVYYVAMVTQLGNLGTGLSFENKCK
jgi:hypothetical protein